MQEALNKLMAMHAKTQLADSESGLNTISVKRFYSYLSEHSGYDYGAAPCMLLAVDADTGRVTTAGYVLLATGAWHGPTATHAPLGPGAPAGPSFRTMAALKQQAQESWAYCRITVPPKTSGGSLDTDQGALHPAVLDMVTHGALSCGLMSCLQQT
jgi:hypothetical protein